MKRITTIASAIMGILTCSTLQVGESFIVDAPVDQLRVRWSKGDMTIIADSEVKGIQVQRLAWGPEANTAFQSTLQGSRLTLQMRCATPVPCGGDLLVRVPPDTAVDVDVSEGAVYAAGIERSLVLVVGSGVIRATELASQEVVMQVARGDVDADWYQAPGRVVATTAEGDVRLVLPVTDYDIQDLAGSGRVVGVRDDPKSQRSISVTALGGEAIIQGYTATVSLEPQV